VCVYREVTKKYIGKGVFAEFNRQMPETTIKKTKKFKQLNFMSGVSSSEGDCSGSQLGFQMDEEEKKQEIAKSSPPPESICSEEQKMAEE
jgi:hypothetical protein